MMPLYLKPQTDVTVGSLLNPTWYVDLSDNGVSAHSDMLNRKDDDD
jgi:hypothetical protein